MSRGYLAVQRHAVPGNRRDTLLREHVAVIVGLENLLNQLENQIDETARNHVEMKP